MMSLHLWLLFAPTSFLVNVTPGPNNLLAMNNAARFGMGRTIASGLGRGLAFTILIGLTIIGLGAMLATSEHAFTVMKWVGAAYLVYLGIRLWRAPVQADDAAAVEAVVNRTSGAAEGSLRGLMTREFLVAISNPKAILFFTAIFPQFLDATLPAWPQFSIMGVTFVIGEMLALMIYAFAGHGAGRFLSSTKGRRVLNRTSGTALLCAGVALAASRR